MFETVSGRLLSLSLMFCVLMGLQTEKALANSQAEYWAFWDSSNEASLIRIDHSQWDEILSTYVIVDHPSGINRFRYGDVSDQDKKKIDSYIKHLETYDPRGYSKLEQKAYWVNLYNALVVQSILKNFPVGSINDINPDGRGRNIWDRKLIKIDSTRLSLNDIENRILRPLWKDFRLLFALSCGGMSCPNLQQQAYTSANIQSMLSDAARDYINHPRGVLLENGHLKASSLFSWYLHDFAPDEKTLIKVMTHYLDDRKALYLLGFQGQIEYAYDWRINSPEM